MGPSINASNRPSRLPIVAHVAVVVLLLLSFISGALIWYGDYLNLNADFDAVRFNVRPWRVLHGILNPVLCVVFGSLLVQHIRMGWQLKANRPTGFFMEAVFAMLIITGAGIYYSPEAAQRMFVSIHRITGLLVPLSLTAHWIAARVWVKRIEK